MIHKIHVYLLDIYSDTDLANLRLMKHLSYLLYLFNKVGDFIFQSFVDFLAPLFIPITYFVNIPKCNRKEKLYKRKMHKQQKEKLYKL